MWLFDWVSEWLFEGELTSVNDAPVLSKSCLDDDFMQSRLGTSATNISSLNADGLRGIGWPDSSGAFDINPANGLPMIDGIESVDVLGNPYGFDNSSLSGHDDIGGGHSGFGHSDW